MSVDLLFYLHRMRRLWKAKCVNIRLSQPSTFSNLHTSQSLSLSALRGNVAMVWHDRLSVDVS